MLSYGEGSTGVEMDPECMVGVFRGKERLGDTEKYQKEGHVTREAETGGM